MKAKKKVRKKHNKLKRIQRNTKGYLVESWESWYALDDNGDPIREARAYAQHPILGKIPVGAKEWDRVNLCARNWLVTVLVECEAPDGQKYYEQTEIEAIQCKMNDLSEIYLRMREESLTACNSRHVKDVGWKAVALT